jgi:hypothetical protein
MENLRVDGFGELNQGGRIMQRLATWSLFSIACCVATAALGRAPLIDPPTPPPCAADGICYPNTGGWGYYPARWRKWTGVQL